MSGSALLKQTIHDLVIANRILAQEGVVDVFGHISVRHPERPDRYLLARSRAPLLVEASDIMEYDLDSNPVDQRGRVMYFERFIHGEVFKARPDVMSVCHNHAYPLLPFSVSGNSIRPVAVPSVSLGREIPIWDIRDDFPDDGELMVTNNAAGRSLQQALGKGAACLMRGHGTVVATLDLKNTVFTSIALKVNAELLMNAHMLKLATGRGSIKYLTDKEIDTQVKTLQLSVGLNRSWEYYAMRAGMTTSINDDRPSKRAKPAGSAKSAKAAKSARAGKPAARRQARATKPVRAKKKAV
jgi:ribulose-5-phosphate 4-epimerase/fuculose-1-phosphate aldolase